MIETPIVECRIEAARAVFKDAGDTTPAERLPWLSLTFRAADGAERARKLSLNEACSLRDALAAHAPGAAGGSPPSAPASMWRESAQVDTNGAGAAPRCAVRGGDAAEPRVCVVFPGDVEDQIIALDPAHVGALVGALDAALARWREDPPAVVADALVGEIAAIVHDGAKISVRVEVEALPAAPGVERRVALSFAHGDGHSDTWLFDSDEADALRSLLGRAHDAAGRRTPGLVGAIGAEPWLSVSVSDDARIVLVFDDEMVRERWAAELSLRLDVTAAESLRELVRRAQELASVVPAVEAQGEPMRVARLIWDARG